MWKFLNFIIGRTIIFIVVFVSISKSCFSHSYKHCKCTKYVSLDNSKISDFFQYLLIGCLKFEGMIVRNLDHIQDILHDLEVRNGSCQTSEQNSLVFRNYIRLRGILSFCFVMKFCDNVIKTLASFRI